ncbi:helix-turn-helix transcriptional regulator [Streptococcus uberis]|uniref:helix-turn-helix domain-containing protein n=1 Tax=Streptococcus uberis TaxID=1349 RepID=UPI001FF4612D|nr:helix-turn-helix transcriptional regulator [Streptococcus uberis]MCK1200449.1 helix-turn-helix transcriptional regulator [Streptococcus uberis]MCK1231616.1 helix-turn-helix transcriptional regulator [Streptococcus uberis]MCK1255390.1 helix-turn-helix transcriptional regulator [Streptococcus uberis]
MIKTNFSVLMAERGLKIADVYEDTGISKTTLMALSENTGKGVQFETVDKLCIYLGIDISEFFLFVPYSWELEILDNYSFYDNEKYYAIGINLKSDSIEKTYVLIVSFNLKTVDRFPTQDKNVKTWVSIYLADSDAYVKNDFYNFIDSLQISFKNKFIQDLNNMVIEIIKNNNGKVFAEDLYKVEEIKLEKGDKIFISFNDDGYREDNIPKSSQFSRIIKY